MSDPMDYMDCYVPPYYIFACPKCGKTLRTPQIGTTMPNTLCPHQDGLYKMAVIAKWPSETIDPPNTTTDPTPESHEPRFIPHCIVVYHNKTPNWCPGTTTKYFANKTPYKPLKKSESQKN